MRFTASCGRRTDRGMSEAASPRSLVAFTYARRPVCRRVPHPFVFLKGWEPRRLSIVSDSCKSASLTRGFFEIAPAKSASVYKYFLSCGRITPNPFL